MLSPKVVVWRVSFWLESVLTATVRIAFHGALAGGERDVTADNGVAAMFGKARYRCGTGPGQ